MSAQNKLRICRVATVPFGLMGSLRQLKGLIDNNIELTIICSKEKGHEKLIELGPKEYIPLTIHREISPIQDLKSLFNLIRVFRQNDYDIVHSNTPKAGLLVAIAGIFVARTKFIHTFTGQRWETLTGFKRKLLVFFDWLINLFNHQNFADSHSQAKYLTDLGLVPKKDLVCLGKGGFAGIDLERFNFEKVKNKSQAIRRELGLADSDFVILFVGRLVEDKGISELLNAYAKLRTIHSNLKLILVGPMENDGNPILPDCQKLIKTDESIKAVGFRSNVEDYMGASDLLCLPSHREGFPMVVIEAATLGLPAVVSDIIGGRDTIVNEQTGLLFKVKDTDDLYAKLQKIMSDKELLGQMSLNAQKFAKENFSIDKMTRMYIEAYQKINRGDQVEAFV